MFEVTQAQPGRLALLPHPSGDLDDALRQLQAQGVSLLVSLLPEAEARMLGLEREAEVCRRIGLGFLGHPVVDYGLPEPAAFDPIIAALARHVQEGGFVAVHCRAGIGRSGLTAAAVLIAAGFTAQAAVSHVSAARGVSVPETEAQRAFLDDFETRWR